MIINNTWVSYKYKIQQNFCSANIFKNITWSKPVNELLYVAYPVAFIKYTFEVKQYKFHLNSRLREKLEPGREVVCFFYSGLSDLDNSRDVHMKWTVDYNNQCAVHLMEVKQVIKLYCNFNRIAFF